MTGTLSSQNYRVFVKLMTLLHFHITENQTAVLLYCVCGTIDNIINTGGFVMDKRFIRTEMLLGEQAMQKLRNSRVAVFGAGGVGGYVIEMLVRSGIGTIDIIDRDIVSLSNINRQIIATDETVGMYKTQAAEKRAKLINPDVIINRYDIFYTPETADMIDFSVFDYVVDAVDTVSAKIEIIMQAEKHHVPVISSMGAGNKLHPEMFEIADIYKTSVCPLARIMRRELKKRGVKKLTVVYSKEVPLTPGRLVKDEASGKVIPASIAFAPSAAGIIIASEVVRQLS